MSTANAEEVQKENVRDLTSVRTHPSAGRGLRGKWSTYLGWFLTVTVVLVWFLLLRPADLGGPASYVAVNGGSMVPTFHTGDLVVVKAHPVYHIGEVVDFTIPAGQADAGMRVIHRIVGGNGVTGFITKGDHNAHPDVWHPRTGNIAGTVWFHVPYGASFMRHPGAFATGVGVFAFVLFAWPSGRQRKAKELRGVPGGARKPLAGMEA